MKKAAWGGGILGSIAAAVFIINALPTLGGFIEPVVTARTNAKIEALAKKQTEDIKAVLNRLDDLEKTLMNRMDENNREQIRLILQTLRQGGSP